MGWDTLTASVITGVSSSLATLLFVTAARRVRLWWRYRKLAGTYQVYRADGAVQQDEEIRLQYWGGRHFILHSRLRRADGTWAESWEGHVNVSEDMPWY